MKILFGYNGSKAAEAAIDDIKHAGLPANSEMLILSVAEEWTDGEQVKHEALRRASELADKVRFSFAHGKVTSQSSVGSPAAEILRVAEQFHPDLIILAEREQSLAEGNIFLGTTTQKVLTEASCSVRIARGRAASHRAVPRILIGFDGSPGSLASVESVANRCWASETEVCLVVVADTAALSSLARFAPQMSNPNFAPKVAIQWGEALADASFRKLSGIGFKVDISVATGNAKEVLVQLAHEQNADAVFVGPHCLGNSFERYLIGSVSTAVAARAECSVEVVRDSTDRINSNLLQR